MSTSELVPSHATSIANDTTTTRTARAVAEAIFSKGGKAPPQERIDWLVGELLDLLAHAGLRAALLLRLSFFIVSWLGPLFVLRPPGIARLPLALRVQALERLERSPVVALFTGAKVVLCTLYYEHPDVARDVGFDGRCLVERGGAR